MSSAVKQSPPDPNVLAFSFNWNNKLECNCFSSIRVWNPHKFQVGKKFKVILKGAEHSEAELVEAKKFQIQFLTEGMARLDTGYEAKEVHKILQKMYPEYLQKHKGEALFGFYIFKKS